MSPTISVASTGRIFPWPISTHSVRNTRDALILEGRSEDLNQPGASKQIAEEAWNQLLLMHVADRLHVHVGDQEVLDLIHNNPGFQKDGVYSPGGLARRVGWSN